MATMSSSQGSSSGSSGPQRQRNDEPIVVHKLIINKTPLNGTESFEAIDEWYEDMASDIDMTIPGVKAILDESEKLKRPITQQDLLTHNNSALASRVSRDMYSVLKEKTSGIA